jgi:glycosyltransferase involved in cell wall biosynthesis
VSGPSPYADFHRLQDEALRHVQPFPSERFEGRGIVMVAGGPRYFTCAWIALNVLRRKLGCTLPIQLWHLGEAELSPRMRELLRPLDVECVDALRVRRRSPFRRLGGWECKPFALLHSRFREVILIDADNVPVVDPTFLFSEPQYERHGAIFWPDIASLPLGHPIWDICRIAWRHQPEFESGQIVLDKARCWAALQLTAHLNEWSDIYYQYVLGDKETFHLAWRMLGQEYGLIPTLPRIAPLRSGPGINVPYAWPCLVQHDFDGREIFYHYAGTTKWNAFGENCYFEGFPYEAFCRELLAELRRSWDGRAVPSPRAACAARTEAEILQAARFLYVRVGIGERSLELLPNGRVGAGTAYCERSWRLDPEGAGRVLVITGEDGDTCRLSLDRDGVWRGNWLYAERCPIELIPLGRDVNSQAIEPDSQSGSAGDFATLLYVSPVVPAFSGNGLAMRAAAVLRLLAEQYAVTLLVLPLYVSPEPTPPPDLASLCERVISASSAAAARAALGDARFDVVHVFRLATLDAMGGLLDLGEERHLDLDDLESETRRQLAALQRLHGNAAAASAKLAEAARYRRLEDDALSSFDRVYVCSEPDRLALAGRGVAEIAVLPNSVAVQGPLPPCGPSEPFTLLFVGTLGYFPNEDGVRWFCAEVLPLLEDLAARPCRVVLVGTGATDQVRGLHAPPRIDVVGEVADLAASYQSSHAVIVPLRAGGGTRIKILEAFSFRRPIVATSIGIAGIEAVHDQHVLVADSATAFAQQCIRLRNEQGLGERLVAASFELFLDRYAPTALRARYGRTLQSRRTMARRSVPRAVV